MQVSTSRMYSQRFIEFKESELSGITRVAVKMLKPDHRPGDVDDLLSEYILLKEVDHPNVIKLLGACTDRRGPLYLIMEFAKYGSLRDYLRRSRRYFQGSSTRSLTSTSSSNKASAVTSFTYSMEDEIPFINQKDLTIYGWQVAKGMEYLADIKVLTCIF